MQATPSNGTLSTGRVAGAVGAVERTGDLNVALGVNRLFGSRTGGDLYRTDGGGGYGRSVPPPPPQAAERPVRPVSPNPAKASRPPRQHFDILIDETVPPGRPKTPLPSITTEQFREARQQSEEATMLWL